MPLPSPSPRLQAPRSEQLPVLSAPLPLAALTLPHLLAGVRLRQEKRHRAVPVASAAAAQRL